ncbi:MAG TPA: Fic family protein [Gemmatimonadaceae bacterium]
MPGRLVRQTWTYDPTIDAPARYKRACRYDAFIPATLATLDARVSGGLAGLLSDAERALRTLNDEGGALLDPLARLLLRTESIASSRIEGLQIGVRELARAEARSDLGLEAGPTAAEVLANIDAMVLAVDDAAEAKKFGSAQIVAIHERLLERAPHRHIAGKVRDTQNWIGGNNYNPCGAEFIPPPPEEVKGLMKDLCAAINDTTLSPVMQAALVHAQFETIHPFGDGNGRTGRALVHVVLKRREVAPRFVPPISVVFAGDKDRYIDGLTKFRGDEVEAWLEQFAVALMRAARLGRAYIEDALALRERWREMLTSRRNAPRAGAAAWAILDVLPAQPMISGAVAVALTRRAKARVYEGMAQLEDAGVLRPLSTGRRNRIWEVDGVLDLVARLEEGRMPK